MHELVQVKHTLKQQENNHREKGEKSTSRSKKKFV